MAGSGHALFRIPHWEWRMNDLAFVSKKTFDSMLLTDPKYGVEYDPPR